MSLKSTFKALDFYTLRIPLLPADFYQNGIAGGQETLYQQLAELAKNPLIREAIAVSSQSLLDSLVNLSPDSTPRKREQTARAFLRYLIRMTTRPTPFGLFAGVTYGGYGEHYGFLMREASSYRKRTRPDMEWLLHVIAGIESNPEILMQLPVTSNTMAYEAGGRIHLPYLARCGQMRNGTAPKLESISVRATDAVLKALSFASMPLTCGELVCRLQNEYSDTPEQQIRQFVLQLFEQELLISCLRPPLLDSSPLKYVIEQLGKISGADEIKAQLKEISERLEAYDRLQTGDGEEAYSQLVGCMKKVGGGTNFLQVDLAVQADELVLPHSVREEVERAAEVLWRLSNDELGLPHMHQYRNAFIEKYGVSREVPLLELLDENIGLGAPPTYEFPRSKRKEERLNFPFQQKKKHLLSQWLMPVLLEGRQELLLDDACIAELDSAATDTRFAPRSFEIFFSLAAESKEAVETGNYRLLVGSSSGSYGAGKSIGRFADIMAPEFRGMLKEIDSLEQQGCADIILAELVYFPGDGRAANVVLTYNNRQYEICMGTTSSKEAAKTIPLSDLAVGVDKDGFYLRSISLGKEVIAVTNHMLNITQTPNVYRFLRELTQERQRNIEMFGWGELNSLPFLPRVRYGRCVLSPARWILNKYVLPSGNNIKEENWDDVFDKYRREWRIPRYVYLTQTDNRLLLDLERLEHLQELRREFFKMEPGQGIILTEMGHEWEELPKSGNQRYFNEFVFPLVKGFEANKRSGVQLKQYETVKPDRRLKLPGSEWLFVKWYGVQDRVDEFLSGHMNDFCNTAVKQQWACACFFMRYADPEPHIRLRFTGEPQKLVSMLLPQLHGFASGCLQEGLLSRMVIDTYEPEVERYGGPGLIQLAEQWFCTDSSIVLQWLRLNQQQLLPIDKDMLAVLSVIDIMERFGLPFDEQLASLNSMVNYKEYLELFRKQRPLYMKLGDARNGFAALSEHPAGGILLPAFGERSGILRYYAEQVAAKECGSTGVIKRLEVMHSIIHMHLNRLYGINREDEKRVLTLSRHTLNNLSPVRGRCT